MNIQGKLEISLCTQNNSDTRIECSISSSRPMQACQIFSGKTIQYTLKTLPLVFSVCAKAQSVAAVRAIESAIASPANENIESHREALLALESLREQALRILMDWPRYIDEKPEAASLSFVSMGINNIIQLLEAEETLSFPAQEIALSVKHRQAWECFSKKLGDILFSTQSDQWLAGLFKGADAASNKLIRRWSERQSTQAARFMFWLNHQDWRYAGSSDIQPLPVINEQELARRLVTEQAAFTRAPQWNGQCYELSWYSRQMSQKNSPISALSKCLARQYGNGIYTRMAARLLEVASLQERLDHYFLKNARLDAAITVGTGLGHANAARGRLTHFVEVRGMMIERLTILAPTEWNFHRNGVAANSLERLQQDALNHEGSIAKQAELLIHAIDPCVGYSLSIDAHKPLAGALH